MFFLVYPLVAGPLGVVFAVFLTRSLARRHSYGTSLTIGLAWTVGLFMPLVVRSSFGDIYAPWYLAWMASPPSAEFSKPGLLITVGVAAAASALTALFVNRSEVRAQAALETQSLA